jgi:predicted esterase
LPRSQLVYTSLEAQHLPARVTLIVLEGAGRQADDLVELARSLTQDSDVIVPNAPRFRVDFLEPPTMSRYWYAGESEGRPDPTTFGDCLFQVEQFVLDVLDGQRQPRPAFLLGLDQGAVLALAATEVIPDRLGGVLAICGYLPEVPGWEPPIRALADLPVLLVNDPNDPALPEPLVSRTTRRLSDEGATLTTVKIPDARKLGPELQLVLREWLNAPDTYAAASNRNSVSD